MAEVLFRKSFVLLLLVLCATIASSRQVARFSHLEEEDKELVRAAYDSPSYDHDAYEEDDDDDLKLGKIELGKDVLWALKAKFKELKAFKKALLANFLSTKLKLKEMLENHKLEHVLLHEKHPHYEKKPSYGYQSPPYQQQYGPEYSAAAGPYAPAPYAQQQYAHDPYYGH